MGETTKKRPKFWPLSRMLAIMVLLVSSIFTTIITGISFYLDYHQEIEEIDNTLIKIEKFTLPVISELVWLFNEKAIKSQINSLVQVEHIVKVTVKSKGRNSKEKVMFDLGPKEEAIKYPFKKEFILKHDKWEIGKLSIIGTKRSIYKKLINKAIYVFASQGLKTIGVSLILLFIFRIYVVKYVDILSKYFKKYGSCESKKLERLAIAPQVANNEIGSLITDVNSMFEKMQFHRDQLEQYKDHLEKLASERTRELEAIEDDLINTAHTAGVAEISSEALHSIGNILNSINMIPEKLKTLRLQSVEQKLIGSLTKIERQWNAGELTPKKQEDLLKLFRAILTTLNKEELTRNADLLKLRIELQKIEHTIASFQEVIHKSTNIGMCNIVEFVEQSIALYNNKNVEEKISISSQFQANPCVYICRLHLMRVVFGILQIFHEVMAKTPEDKRLVNIVVDEDEEKKAFLCLEYRSSEVDKAIIAGIGQAVTDESSQTAIKIKSYQNIIEKMAGRLDLEKGIKNITFMISFSKQEAA